MELSNVVVGFSGKLKFNEIKQMFARIIGDAPIIFVNFHNPADGFGGITTVCKSIKKIRLNFSVVYRSDTPVFSKNKKEQSVYIEDELNFNFQKIYGKSYLWPLLHGMKPNLQKKEVEAGRRATMEASNRFADKIIYAGKGWKKTTSEKPIYWINDYLLTGVATALREKDPFARIALSIRSPFDISSKSKIYKEDINFLLQGMCSSDFISFHRKRDVENFFKLIDEYRHLFKDNIKIDHELKIIIVGERTATPRAIPMGNDPYYRSQLSRNAKTKKYVEYLKELAGGRKVIASISSLEINKGIMEELNIFEKLIQINPGFVKEYVLMRVMPIRSKYDDLSAYKKLKEDVLFKINQINTKYGQDELMPIITFLDPGGFKDYQVAALQKISKLYLVLSLADGFNHSSVEFLLTKNVDDVPGLLITSDVGASDYLGPNLMRINPKRVGESALFLTKVLGLPESRISLNQNQLAAAANNLSSFHWTLSILSSIIKPTLVPKWRFNENKN